ATPLTATLELLVPGTHNALNATAAILASLAVDAQLPATIAGLGTFHGTGRRFEQRGLVNNIRVIDDYAHHPTEIAALLTAARQASTGQVLALFQPHLYSRTETFAQEFADALSSADIVVVTDIYAAREA